MNVAFSLGLRPLKLLHGQWPRLFEFAEELGIEALELEGVQPQDVASLRELMERTGVRVHAIASMNTAYLGPDETKAREAIENLRSAIAIARSLDAKCVGTFAGNDPGRTLEENVARFTEVFAPLVREAEAAGISIAIENCPMVGGQPPVARNIAYCPAHWTRLFAAVPSPALGLEFDVGHLPGLGIKIGRCIRDFADRIKHVHLKDAWVDPELQQSLGMIHGASAVHGIPRPGCHIDFAGLFRELADAGYRGPVTLDLRPSTEALVRMAAVYLRPLLEPWRGCTRSSCT